MMRTSDNGHPKNPTKHAAFIHDSGPHEELIKVFGEIDIENEREFEESISKLAGLRRPVVVDFMGCTYLDSRAAGVLMRSSQTVQLRVIAPAHGNVERVFTILRLPELLPVEFRQQAVLPTRPAPAT